MPRKRPLTPPAPPIPHLDHAILRAANNPECIRRQRPDALDVAKVGAQAFLRGDGPEADGGVEGTGEHVARGKGAGGLGGEGGAKGGVGVGGGGGGGGAGGLLGLVGAGACG